MNISGETLAASGFTWSATDPFLSTVSRVFEIHPGQKHDGGGRKSVNGGGVFASQPIGGVNSELRLFRLGGNQVEVERRCAIGEENAKNEREPNSM